MPAVQVSDDDRIVRREVYWQREDDRYPSEKGWTAEGTWVIPFWHLGRWTDRERPEDMTLAEARIKGRISRDELMLDVIGMAGRHLGWHATPEQQRYLHAANDQMPEHHGRDGQLTPELAEQIADTARSAVAWANEHTAPAGRRFVLEDALYLIEAPS